jgi:hypothetical protein
MSSEFNLVESNKELGLVLDFEFERFLLALTFGLCSAFIVVSTVAFKFPKGITETDVKSPKEILDPVVSTLLTELLIYSVPFGF